MWILLNLNKYKIHQTSERSENIHRTSLDMRGSSGILINLENERKLSESKNLWMKNVLDRKHHYFLILKDMSLKSGKRKNNS